MTCPYLTDAFEPSTLRILVEKCAAKLVKIHETHPYDGLAFRGESGACVAYPLSFYTGIPIFCVRKEYSHSTAIVEGPCTGARYLIIDDCIDTGATIRDIVRAMGDEGGTPIGILLWHDNGWNYRDVCGHALPVWSVSRAK